MTFLPIKNPEKITHNTSLKEYLNDIQKPFPETALLGFIITKHHNDMFKPSFDIGFKTLTVEGCLLTFPVCAKPKFSFFNPYYKIHKTKLILSSKKFDLDNFKDQTGATAKKFFSDADRHLWGKLYFDSSLKGLGAENNLGIEIYNSYPEFIQFFYEKITTSGEEVQFSLLVQKMGNLSFFPIIDLMFTNYEFQEISRVCTCKSHVGFPSDSGRLIMLI